MLSQKIFSRQNFSFPFGERRCVFAGGKNPEGSGEGKEIFSTGMFLKEEKKALGDLHNSIDANILGPKPKNFEEEAKKEYFDWLSERLNLLGKDVADSKYMEMYKEDMEFADTKEERENVHKDALGYFLSNNCEFRLMNGTMQEKAQAFMELVSQKIKEAEKIDLADFTVEKLFSDLPEKSKIVMTGFIEKVKLQAKEAGASVVTIQGGILGMVIDDKFIDYSYEKLIESMAPIVQKEAIKFMNNKYEGLLTKLSDDPESLTLGEFKYIGQGIARQRITLPEKVIFSTPIDIKSVEQTITDSIIPHIDWKNKKGIPPLYEADKKNLYIALISYISEQVEEISGNMTGVKEGMPVEISITDGNITIQEKKESTEEEEKAKWKKKLEESSAEDILGVWREYFKIPPESPEYPIALSWKDGIPTLGWIEGFDATYRTLIGAEKLAVLKNALAKEIENNTVFASQKPEKLTVLSGGDVILFREESESDEAKTLHEKLSAVDTAKNTYKNSVKESLGGMLGWFLDFFGIDLSNPNNRGGMYGLLRSVFGVPKPDANTNYSYADVEGVEDTFISTSEDKNKFSNKTEINPVDITSAEAKRRFSSDKVYSKTTETITKQPQVKNLTGDLLARFPGTEITKMGKSSMEIKPAPGDTKTSIQMAIFFEASDGISPTALSALQSISSSVSSGMEKFGTLISGFTGDEDDSDSGFSALALQAEQTRKDLGYPDGMDATRDSNGRITITWDSGKTKENIEKISELTGVNIPGSSTTKPAAKSA